MSERQLTRVRASRVSTMLQGATRNLLHYATAKQNLRFASSDLIARSVTPSCLSGRLRRTATVVSSMSGGERHPRMQRYQRTTAPARRRAHQPAQPRGPRPCPSSSTWLGNDFGTTIWSSRQPGGRHLPGHRDHARRTRRHGAGRLEYVVVGASVVHCRPSPGWRRALCASTEHDDRPLLGAT